MGYKKALGRRQERRKLRIGRVARALVGNLAYVLLGGAILLLAVIVVAAARQMPAPATTVSGHVAATRAAATSSAESGWIKLSSQSPGAIIAAARKTSLFNVNRSGDGDYLKDLSHLETPVLVRAAHGAGPDFYVIPIDDASGQMVGAAELTLNPAHTAVQLMAIITYTSARPHGQLARMSVSAAVADVASQQRVALRAGAQPQLVYLPIDGSALETGQITWNGGGMYPGDPVWLIPGADGQDHVVGTNGHAYNLRDVPLMKQP